MRKIKFFVIVICLSFYTIQSFAKLSLPRIFLNNMILQRDVNVPVWGWASPNEKIQISFKEKTYETTSAADGKWMIQLDASQAGGPFEMIVSADKEKIVIKNILVGDVFLCSGQSNMVLGFHDPRLKEAYAKEIAESKNDQIRQILVNRTFASYPQTDFASAGWFSAQPDKMDLYSAGAYFFAKALYEKYHVPIGIINSSYGGTCIEGWMSEDAINKFPQFSQALEYLKDTIELYKEIKQNPIASKAWDDATDKRDKGLQNGKALWASMDFNDNDWQTIQEPAPLADWTKQNPYYGVTWLRKKININNDAQLNEESKISLGYIVDEDVVYINGTEVGHNINFRANRIYSIPKGVLKKGDNVIAIRIKNYNTDQSGINPHSNIFISIGASNIPLKGDWKYKKSYSVAYTKPIQRDLKNLPTSLYNAMIAPLIPYSIKGIVWYQGEYNASRSYEYRELLPDLFTDWRTKWNVGNIPIIYEQLPNFQNPSPNPSVHPWSELREAQLMTLNKVPNVGMAVAIDLAADGNLHPVDKKDVGERWALQAKKLIYGENIVASGPIYTSMEIKGNKIILNFKDIGGGLMAKGGEPLKQFSIAGADKKFVWADAKIVDNTVEVSGKDIANPVAVRYAWAGNPDGCNLYNKEGLPASPFRTDDWRGLTEGAKYEFK